jgi:ribosomal protein S18 acetylase RimI-like enzyme
VVVRYPTALCRSSFSKGKRSFFQGGSVLNLTYSHLMVNQTSKDGMKFVVRTATEADAAAIIAILEGIASEQIYTAINKPWSADQQRRYLMSLSPRETIHLAETEREGVCGYQVLDLWAPSLDSMAHVGQLGTFLRPEWRRQGIGQALFENAVEFAGKHDFRKFVIQVRSSNVAAQEFYGRLGFRACGRLARQVRIGKQEDDEIIMEYFL